MYKVEVEQNSSRTLGRVLNKRCWDGKVCCKVDTLALTWWTKCLFYREGEP